MADIKRPVTRADRRQTTRGNESRLSPSTFNAYSQVLGEELQIFAQTSIIADNIVAAREELRRHLLRNANTKAVAIDLQKADLVDTRGLALLFDFKREAAGQGRSFILQNPSRAVLRLLNITRLTRIFPVRMTAVADTLAIPRASQTKKP